MESENSHARNYRLRYYEMDERGEATPVAILNLLEETAFSHCEETGWDVFRLVSEGYGWVLLRGGLRMYRYPAYRDDFRVESWCSGTKGFYGTREYRISDGEGGLLGFARSLWLFYSLERRRPVPVLGDIVSAWKPGGPAAGDLGLDEVEAPAAAALDEERSFAVRLADIDTNGHVNNVNYLAWALESIPEDLRAGRFLSLLRGQFKREVTYGSTVRAALQGGGGPCSFLHGAYATSPDGGEPYLAAVAESAWETRKASRGGLFLQSEAATEPRSPAA
jgi:medium-chain acyl-[acyl-carrier-protein] hydrolase